MIYNYVTVLFQITGYDKFWVLFITKVNICVTLVNNKTFTEMSKFKTIEKEKVVAEQLNGRFAMLGFIAAVGAYLTTGQIIPGIV